MACVPRWAWVLAWHTRRYSKGGYKMHSDVVVISEWCAMMYDVVSVCDLEYLYKTAKFCLDDIYNTNKRRLDVLGCQVECCHVEKD